MNRPAAATAALTRPQAMARVLQGVADDLVAYRHLQGLLQQQFDAALRHQSAHLAELAELIVAQVEAMETRRRQRVSLITGLLGQGASMNGLFALLKGATLQQLESDWHTLEELVQECKNCNARNSALLTEQYGIMQRVLHGEGDVYAPL